MAEPAYAYEKGEIIQTPSMSFPIERKYDELNKTETFYEHAHDEPVYYALAANEYLKGCKNAYFKYGGIGIDFSLPLLRCGLLSHKPETINGATIAPFDFVLSHIPPAPKYENEIQSIIDEGIEEDGGCLVVEAYGKKDGKKVLNELHVSAPGLIESFKRAKLTAEQYLTGQSGGLFTKLFVEEKYEQTGLISTVMLTYKEIDYY
jgi:saccharopine dehydrogenase-like NADP-dependent oxidoreductase